MNTEQMRMVAAFWIAKKLGPEVGGFSAFRALRIAFAELIWPFPLALDALLLSVALEMHDIKRLTLALVVAAAVAPR